LCVKNDAIDSVGRRCLARPKIWRGAPYDCVTGLALIRSYVCIISYEMLIPSVLHQETRPYSMI